MADAKAVNAGLALIDGLKPENELEAMLIAQMAATHGLAMKYSARLYNGTITTIAEQDSSCPNPVSAAAGFHNPNRSRCRTCGAVAGRRWWSNTCTSTPAVKRSSAT